MTSSKFNLQVSILISLVFTGFTFSCVEMAKAQTVTSPATNPAPTQPVAPRPKPTFFETQSKLTFGEGDFLESALDGAQNAFADTTKIQNSVFRNFYDPFSSPIFQTPGTVTVLNRDPNSSQFLTTQFSGGGATFNISNAVPSSNPQVGTITLSGSIGGTNVSGVWNYNAGYSANGNLYTGVVQLTRPSSPGQSLLIQIPVTSDPNANNLNAPVSGSATLTFGRPVDR
ncbi:hypothetical protein TUMEXPCC7403_13635 [Tumidithrix helvetica PCC 7403]|uniref:hypothetical protein n=1 Tax=Tumidithrix helvetica TaxID=3457545 RepID=UPI003C9603B7